MCKHCIEDYFSLNPCNKYPSHGDSSNLFPFSAFPPKWGAWVLSPWRECLSQNIILKFSYLATMWKLEKKTMFFLLVSATRSKKWMQFCTQVVPSGLKEKKHKIKFSLWKQKFTFSYPPSLLRAQMVRDFVLSMLKRSCCCCCCCDAMPYSVHSSTDKYWELTHYLMVFKYLPRKFSQFRLGYINKPLFCALWISLCIYSCHVKKRFLDCFKIPML